MFVDEFDPHEPFDTLMSWTGRYEAEPWDGEAIIWPPYADAAITEGNLTEAEGRHIRANYGSKFSMIDHWLGRILDEFDARNLRDTTALIVGTDHGHYLGEPRHVTHGRSLVPLLTGLTDSIRPWAGGGVFGNWVRVTDGTSKYTRSAQR